MDNTLSTKPRNRGSDCRKRAPEAKGYLKTGRDDLWPVPKCLWEVFPSNTAQTAPLLPLDTFQGPAHLFDMRHNSKETDPKRSPGGVTGWGKTYIHRPRILQTSSLPAVLCHQPRQDQVSRGTCPGVSLLLLHLQPSARPPQPPSIQPSRLPSAEWRWNTTSDTSLR